MISTQQANYDGNYVYGGGAKGEDRKATVPVDLFPPNPWGLHQVHGNVWEWAADCWHYGYNDAPSDGSAWTTGECKYRVLRGGSWNLNPGYLRAAGRGWDSPDDRGNTIGFRVARALGP